MNELIARLRAGHVVRIVDLSPMGALVETGRRLLPGSRVELHVEHDGRRELVRASVVRCYVASVRPHLIVYRGGLQFDVPLGLAVMAFSAREPRPPSVPSQQPGASPMSTKLMVRVG